MRHSYTTHDGLNLHVTIYGPADAALTVVLAHCWTADEDDWHYQVRDLLGEFGHQIRLITWDHRGHGRSDAAPESACTIANLARDMGGLLATYAPDGPLLIAGHSVGGMTMTAIPEQCPELIDRLVGLLFVSTAADGLDKVTLGLPEMGQAMKSQIPRVLASRARLLTRTKRRNSPTIERSVVHRFLFGEPMRLRDAGLVVDQLICAPPATMAGFYRDFMDHDRVTNLKAFDQIPTRVLVGSRDLLTPPPLGRRLADEIAGARLFVVPGAGHMLPLERDEFVSGQLIEMVRDAL